MNILEQKNLVIAKADKGKTMVIRDKNTHKHKIDNFIQENQIILMDKDPTEAFQKYIEKTIQICNILIDKRINKHFIQIKPTAPKLNALIKIHVHHLTKLPNTSVRYSTT